MDMSDEKKKGVAAAQAMAAPMSPPGLINKEDIPQVLPILPLRNSVFFPGGVLPLAVGRQKTIALIKDAVRDTLILFVPMLAVLLLVIFSPDLILWLPRLLMPTYVK